MYPSFTWKLVMRRAMDLAPPNALLDMAFGSARFRDLARTIFFHHRGLLTADAWRDLVHGAASPSASGHS
jgi:hypothetical protein